MGKGDPWSGFIHRVMEAPHLTDGFSEFYYLYTHAAYYSQKMNSTCFEVIDFLVDKTYFIHLDEKAAEKYEFDFEDEDDDYILITLDGVYKQLYIGRDIPICFEKSNLSVQPIVAEIVEDM